MSIQHSAITDPNIHEPKGAASASADTVYVADGAGSGDWQAVTTDQITMSGVHSATETAIGDDTITITGRGFMTAVIDDISSADQIYIPFPKAVTVVAATTVLNGAITTGDATITFKDAAGSSMGTITVANSGSAEGDIDTATFSSNNSIAANQAMEIETDGGSTNAVKLFVTVEYTYEVNTGIS